jgi:hypothetical protein
MIMAETCVFMAGRLHLSDVCRQITDRPAPRLQAQRQMPR